MTYEIRIMTAAGHFKTIKTSDFSQACRIYQKYQRFANQRGIYLKIALWCNGWLLESATIHQQVGNLS